MANFVPKYTPQAVRFDSMITTINTALSDSYEKVNSINSEISIDASSEDALAVNTILLTNKIKTEIGNKIDSNDLLSSSISSAAKKFDDEDYEDFLEAERIRKRREAEKAKSVIKEQEKEAVPDIVPIKGYKEITAVLK